MTDQNPTAKELAHALNDLLKRLEHFGYPEIHSPSVTITTDSSGDVSISAELRVYDKFQEELDWSRRIQQGTLHFSFINGAFHIPSGFMTLEMREMAVAAAVLGKTKEMMMAMTSAFATEYVESLTRDMLRFQQINQR